MEDLFLENDSDTESNDSNNEYTFDTKIKEDFDPEILNVQIVALWEWTDIKDPTCSICRKDFCQIDQFDSFCVIGECGHGFHNNCIATYHQTCNNNFCPLCECKWKPINNIE